MKGAAFIHQGHIHYVFPGLCRLLGKHWGQVHGAIIQDIYPYGIPGCAEVLGGVPPILQGQHFFPLREWQSWPTNAVTASFSLPGGIISLDSLPFWRYPL